MLQACTLTNETFNDSHQDQLDACNETKWQFILDSRVRISHFFLNQNFLSLTIFTEISCRWLFFQKFPVIDNSSKKFLHWPILPLEMPQAASKEYKCNGDLWVLEQGCRRCRGKLSFFLMFNLIVWWC